MHLKQLSLDGNSHMAPPSIRSPFSIPNIRRFIAFRAFFNARFYYPVFTVFFLDFGLTLSQFAILNSVWAATIVLMEVPLGALADLVGRRRLLTLSGALMVLEMAVLCLVPTGHPGLMFGAFLINRVLSGTAEAAASGADEALAYDSLTKEGDSRDWGRVLEVQMRVQSATFILVMSLGAAVYDPALVQWLAHMLGFKVHVTQDMTLRFPVFLTLITAVLTWITSLGMHETPASGVPTCKSIKGCEQAIVHALQLTVEAGRWILRTPAAFIVILSGLLFDHVIRMLITMNSQYYRLIQLPEASFGLIGSAMAGLGLVMPRVALLLARKRSQRFNLAILAGVTLLALSGMSRFVPIYGLLPVMALMSVMFCVNFLVSHYLNEVTDSERRATVLSFKGLLYNMAYGLIGILYSGLLGVLGSRSELGGMAGPGAGPSDSVFVESIGCFPAYFAVLLACLVFYAHRRLRGSSGLSFPRRP